MKYLLIFLFNFLFAHIIYVPKGFEYKFPKDYEIKTYSSLNKVDFNNFVVIKNNDFPIVFDKNLKVIAGIKPQREVIVSYKPFNEIETIANVDLPTKIFLSIFNKKFKFVKGTLEDLKHKKIDAYVAHKEIPNLLNYDSGDFEIRFHKYYLVSSKEFEKKNDSSAEFLKEYLVDNNLNNQNLLLKDIIFYSLYFRKKIDFSTLDENYFYQRYSINTLRVILAPTWPPFDFIQNGRLVGIGVDMWKLIAKKAHLKYKFIITPIWIDVLKAIKEKRADITPNTSATPDREKYAIFSRPYMEFPYAVICRKGENIHSIKDIKNIAVGYNYTAYIEMKKHYPNIKYIEVRNVLEAVKLVVNKKAQCAVDVLPVIAYIVNKNHFVNLEVKYLTPFKFKLQVMVRKDLDNVRDKINKAIDSISDEEKQKIINKYVSLTIVKPEDNTLKIVLVIGVLIILILIYFYLKIRKAAYLDELTKILNRRGFEKEIRNIKKGSVIFIDVDHFKKVNDTYGHEFGDYVLKEFANVVKQNIRNSDIFARIGGEEFVLILPHTSYESALKVAEKLRKAIEKHDFKGKKITASFGVSEFEGDLQMAIEIADEALYEAKRNGRNQVKGKR